MEVVFIKKVLLSILIIINNLFLYVYIVYQFVTVCWVGEDSDGNKTGGCVPNYEFQQINFFIMVLPIAISVLLTIWLLYLILHKYIWNIANRKNIDFKTTWQKK